MPKVLSRRFFSAWTTTPSQSRPSSLDQVACQTVAVQEAHPNNVKEQADRNEHALLSPPPTTMSWSVSASPASIAGVQRMVRWMRTQL